MGSRALGSDGNASLSFCCTLCPQQPVVSHLGYSWADFETEEDLLEGELYGCILKEDTDSQDEREVPGLSEPPCTFSSDLTESPFSVSSQFTNPFRNPESPLDTGDVDLYKRETAQRLELAGYFENDCPDAKNGSLSSTPTIRPSGHSLEDTFGSFDEQQGLGATDDPLEPRLARLEKIIEEHLRSMQQEIIDIRMFLATRQRKSSELADIDVTASSGFSAHGATTRDPEPEVSTIEQYIQDWHNGGLILVENIPKHTSAREIHALFEVCGDITYLELHGAADKSKPHLPTRHAYIHFSETSHAAYARNHYHGFYFNKTTLLVFMLSTAEVRGDKPYVGPALEVLHFRGGQNYIAPEAPDAAAPPPSESNKTKKSTTFAYSTQPKLTIKTDVVFWRRVDPSKSVRPKLTIKTDLDACKVDIPKAEALRPKLTTKTDISNANRPKAAPPRPKLTIKTNVFPFRKVETPKVHPATEEEPARELFKPKLTLKTDLCPTPPSDTFLEQSESSPLDVVKSGVVGAERQSAEGSEDDELVVFQGTKKRFLHTPPAVVAGKDQGETKKEIEKESKKVGLSLVPKATIPKATMMGRMIGKLVSIFRWGR